jgi:thiamine-phosphate pyrophosphorylase
MTAAGPEATQLMLALEVGEGAAARLAAVLAVAPIASIVLCPGPSRAISAADAAPLIASGQGAGVAMLIESDAELARALRADGVHIPVSDNPLAALEAARAWVGGRAIVGVDAGRSRHDAMSLGEAGADYVAFGIPAFVKEREDAADRRAELVAWWAEIFEVPVVAMDVVDRAEVRLLSAAGADFVCLRISTGMPVADAADFATAARDDCSKARTVHRPEDA